MIDLHCHVLPGIDDGPASIGESIALARYASQCGIETVVATPHVSSRYPNRAPAIAELVNELNEALEDALVPVKVLPGAEIAASEISTIDPAELDRLGLARGSWLLVEPPFASSVTGLSSVIRDLQLHGHHVILAHPERCMAFHRDPDILAALIGAGVPTSVTAGALVGRFGSRVRRFALSMARDGLIHNVASDAHDLEGRRPSIAAELAQAGLSEIQKWLTREVPAAILRQPGATSSTDHTDAPPTTPLVVAKTIRRHRMTMVECGARGTCHMTRDC